MLRSMVRSMAEKPTSSGVDVEHDLKVGATEPAFQPNMRIARSSQRLGVAGRSTPPSFTTASRLGVSRGLSHRVVESPAFQSTRSPVRIGLDPYTDPNAELGETLFETFHGLGVVVRLVVASRSNAGSRGPPDG